MSYAVESTGSAFSVVEEGDALSVETDADHVLDAVYRRVHQRAFELASLLGWVRVHAALVTLAAGRVLAVGPSGVGKTTLASRLLFDGVRVDGDESVVLRNGRALAVARPFHLKPGIDDHVPELRPLWSSLPCLEGDPPIRAFDPSVAGFAWTIDDGPVHHVVPLGKELHGDGPVLEPISATTAMPSIVDQVFRNQEPTRAVVAEVAAVRVPASAGGCASATRRRRRPARRARRGSTSVPARPVGSRPEAHPWPQNRSSTRLVAAAVRSLKVGGRRVRGACHHARSTTSGHHVGAPDGQLERRGGGHHHLAGHDHDRGRPRRPRAGGDDDDCRADHHHSSHHHDDDHHHLRRERRELTTWLKNRSSTLLVRAAGRS